MRLEGPLHFGYGVHAADGGHIALVEVAEGGARLAVEIRGDDFGHMIAHLHGRLGHAGNLVAVLLEMGQVAQDENFRQARRVEPVIDDHAAALVGWRAQQLAQRRGLHACGPKRDGGVDPIAPGFALRIFYFHPAGSDRGHMGLRMHFNAQALE